MLPIEILYLLASGMSVVAMGPQIRQILVMKTAENLHPITWIAWMITQGIAMMYALGINAWPFFLVSMAWFLFYGLMVGLIVKYRYESRRTSTDSQRDHL